MLSVFLSSKSDNNLYGDSTRINFLSPTIAPDFPNFTFPFSQNKKYSFPGYITTDCQKKISSFNKKWISLWRFPEQLEQLILSLDGEQVLLFINKQILEPANFWEVVSSLYREPARVMHEDIFKLDSEKTLLISSDPLFLDAEIVGRTWNFRQLNPNE